MIKKSFNILLIGLFLNFLPVISYAQDMASIKGVILSEKDLTEIAFAHISIDETTIGTVSNNNGEFSMVFPSDRIGDILIISSIGYKTQRIPISKVMTEKKLEIILSFAEFTLSQTIIEGDELSAHRLVQKAISKIEDNYDERPVILTQFYREFLKVHAQELHRTYENKRKAKKKNENLDNSFAYNVIEGLFQVYKVPYHGKGSGKKDLAKLIKGRRIDYVPQTKSDSVIQDLVFKYPHKGGPHDMLKHDILKDPSDANFMKKKSYKKYNFKTVGITEYAGRGVFKVIFDQKPDVEDALYKGEIYIDTASYAFVKIDFTMSPTGLDYQSFGVPGWMLKLVSGIEMKMTGFHANLTYQEFRGKWYLDYYDVGGVLNVLMDKGNNKKEMKMDATLEIRGELLVTNIDKLHVRKFSDDELFKGNDTMDEYVGDFDDDFWDNENYILPTKEMIKQINAQKVRTSGLD